MSNTVNLNRFRKRKARAGKEQRAAENRAKFGRTKVEKNRDAKEKYNLERRLDAHERDDD